MHCLAEGHQACAQRPPALGSRLPGRAHTRHLCACALSAWAPGVPWPCRPLMATLGPPVGPCICETSQILRQALAEALQGSNPPPLPLCSRLKGGPEPCPPGQERYGLVREQSLCRWDQALVGEVIPDLRWALQPMGEKVMGRFETQIHGRWPGHNRGRGWGMQPQAKEHLEPPGGTAFAGSP
jgi:hypothetical protein